MSLTPKDVTFQNSTFNSFELIWDHNRGIALDTYVDVSTFSDFRYIEPYWSNRRILNAPPETIKSLQQNTNFGANAKYYVRVRHHDGSSYSDYVTIEGWTLPKKPSININDKGELLLYSYGSDGSYYKVTIKRYNISGEQLGDYDHKEIPLIPGFTPLNDIPYDLTYYLELTLANPGGESEKLTTTFSVTRPYKNSIPKPRWEDPTDISSFSFTVNWENTGAKDYFLRLTKFNGRYDEVIDEYNGIIVTDNHYNFKGLEAETTYYAWVRGRNEEGEESNYSGIKIIQTTALPVPILTIKQQTYSLIAEWTESSDAPSLTWEIQISETNAFDMLMLDEKGIPGHQNTFQFDNLNAHTYYFIRIRPEMKGKTGEWVIIQEKTLQVLYPPSIFTVERIDEGFKAIWNLPHTATETLLYVSTDDFKTHIPNYNGKRVIANNHTDEVTIPDPNLIYKFRVKARRYLDNYETDYSDIVTVDRWPELTISPGVNIAMLEWSGATNNPAHGWEIELSKSEYFGSTTEQSHQDIAGNIYEFQVENLEESTMYYVRIRTIIGDFIGEWTQNHFATLLRLPTPVALPEEKVAHGFRAKWSKEAGGVPDEFLLYVSHDNFETHLPGYNGKVFSREVLSEEVIIPNPNLIYSYRVKARRHADDYLTEYSNTITVAINLALPATKIRTTSFQANWQPLGSTYQLYVKEKYGDTIVVDGVTINNESDYVVEGLEDFSAYTYYVVYEDMEDLVSNEIQVITFDGLSVSFPDDIIHIPVINSLRFVKQGSLSKSPYEVLYKDLKINYYKPSVDYFHPFSRSEKDILRLQFLANYNTVGFRLLDYQSGTTIKEKRIEPVMDSEYVLENAVMTVAGLVGDPNEHPKSVLRFFNYAKSFILNGKENIQWQFGDSLIGQSIEVYNDTYFVRATITAYATIANDQGTIYSYTLDKVVQVPQQFTFSSIEVIARFTKRADLMKTYELNIPTETLEEGKYAIELYGKGINVATKVNTRLEKQVEGKYISEPISVANQFINTVRVEYKNDDSILNQTEIDYSTGIQHQFRIQASLDIINSKINAKRIEMGNGLHKIISAKMLPQLRLTTKEHPDYIHEMIRRAELSDFFSIDGIVLSANGSYEYTPSGIYFLTVGSGNYYVEETDKNFINNP